MWVGGSRFVTRWRVRPWTTVVGPLFLYQRERQLELLG